MAGNEDNLPKRILLVDDDTSIAALIDEGLQRQHITLDKAQSLDTALYYFNQTRYDVVLVSLEFKPMQGLVLVQRWRAHEIPDRRCVGFIMVTGNKITDSNTGLIKELGDLEVLPKPFSVIQLLPVLQKSMATRRRLLAFQELKDKVLSYYAKTNDLAKSIEAVKKRLPELGHKGISVLYGLYEKAERYDDALNLIGPLSDRDPTNAGLLNAKATMLMHLGRYDEAKPLLEKLDELAPQNIARIEQLTDAYMELNQPDDGVSKMKEMITLSPDQPDLKFEMFSKLYEHGYDDHAVSLGKETTTPMEIVRFYNNKGVVLSKNNEIDKALKEYDHALKFYPQFKKNYLIYFNVALAHMHTKTVDGYEKAQKSLKLCLQLEPTYDKARQAMEQVEKVLQQHKKAS